MFPCVQESRKTLLIELKNNGCVFCTYQKIFLILDVLWMEMKSRRDRYWMWTLTWTKLLSHEVASPCDSHDLNSARLHLHRTLFRLSGSQVEANLLFDSLCCEGLLLHMYYVDGTFVPIFKIDKIKCVMNTCWVLWSLCRRNLYNTACINVIYRTDAYMQKEKNKNWVSGSDAVTLSRYSLYDE